MASSALRYLDPAAEWDGTVPEIEPYNGFYRSLVGQDPVQPVVAARVIVGDTDEEARALARRTSLVIGRWPTSTMESRGGSSRRQRLRAL